MAMGVEIAIRAVRNKLTVKSNRGKRTMLVKAVKKARGGKVRALGSSEPIPSSAQFFTPERLGSELQTCTTYFWYQQVAGVIGDISSGLTQYEALITSSVKIPHCSYASSKDHAKGYLSLIV